MIGVAAILILKLSGQASEAAQVAEAFEVDRLLTTLATLGLSILVVSEFNTANPDFQFVETVRGSPGLSYRMGVDGISVLFVLLTAFLMPLCIAAGWKSITSRVEEYLIAFLILETLMIGVFCALDLVRLLHLLRGRPDPDVPDHRDLGRQEPGLRGL